MTLLLYVRRKEWPLKGVTVECTHERIDRNEYRSEAGGEQPWVDVIRQRIMLTGDLTAEQRDRVHYIAGRCPIHRMLENAPVIEEDVEMVG